MEQDLAAVYDMEEREPDSYYAQRMKKWRRERGKQRCDADYGETRIDNGISPEECVL